MPVARGPAPRQPARALPLAVALEGSREDSENTRKKFKKVVRTLKVTVGPLSLTIADRPPLRDVSGQEASSASIKGV